jgi:hypothetical protein
MTEDIIRKLTKELNAGIKTEVQVVYLLAGIRKLIERDKRKDEFANLNFHCDWALHPQMDRKTAQSVLKHFDAAIPLFKDSKEISDFPRDLQRQIVEITKLALFKQELSECLEAYGLPSLAQPYGWAYFLYLYTRVIEDIALVVTDPARTSNVSKVVVTCELARETMKRQDHEHQLFKVSWNIYDKDGNSGEFYVLNGFDVVRRKRRPLRKRAVSTRGSAAFRLSGFRSASRVAALRPAR